MSADDVIPAADNHRANWQRLKDRNFMRAATENAYLVLEQYMTRSPVSKFYVKMAGDSEAAGKDEIIDPSEQRSRQIKFRKQIHHKIGALARKYYSDKYDYLLISNDFNRSEAKKIVKSYEILLELYKSLSTETRQYIEIECQHRRTAYGETSLKEMTSKLKEDLDFLSPLAETLPTNTFPYVKHSVDTAANIYKLCTGKRVSRNIKRLELDGSAEFQNHGVEFTYVLLNAIDNDISRANIATYARKLGRR